MKKEQEEKLKKEQEEQKRLQEEKIKKEQEDKLRKEEEIQKALLQREIENEIEGEEEDEVNGQLEEQDYKEHNSMIIDRKESSDKIIDRSIVSSTPGGRHIKNKQSELKIERSSVNNSKIGIEDFTEEENLKEEQKYSVDQKIEEESDVEIENKSLGDGMEKNDLAEDKYDSSYYKERLKQKPTWVTTTFKLSLALIKEKKWEEALNYIK